MKTRTSCIFIFLFSIYELINAQCKIDGYSINPKLGAYNWLGENIGLAQGCEINILSNNNIYSIDYLNCSIILDIPSNNQIDFLFGKYIGDRYLRLQFQGGIGTCWGTVKGDRIGTYIPSVYEKIEYITVGIPLKLGFKLLPIRFLSIGIDFQANLNFKYPIYMTMVSVEIGKLRNKIINVP